MPNLSRFRSRRLRRALVVATALSIVPLTAFAGDVAPTPEGAQKIVDIFATYLGQGATTATPASGRYAVSIDLAKVFAPLASQGVSIDSAPAKLELTEQTDGAWRVSRDGYSPVTVHFKDGDLSLSVDGYKFDGVFDPAIAGFRKAEAKTDKSGFQLHSPQVDETIGVGPTHISTTGAAGPGGGLTGGGHEEAKDITMVVTPKKTDAAQVAPAPVTIQIGGVSAVVNFGDLRSQQILDLWRFLVAHPSRAALATDEDGLKSRLRAVIPFADKLDETIAAQTIAVESPKGPVKLDGVKAHFVAEKFLTAGDTEIQVAFAGIAPPPGVVPPALHDLAPTAVDIDVKYGGYDFRGGIEEAINDMHLAGEGPVISEADRPKISAKMMGAGPINITILPSHVVAPQLDLSVEGAIQVVGDRPVGKITVTARNFDNTIAAIKGAGPLATPQVLAGLTMAKGLGKAGPDGSTSWVAEYSADGAIKLNGLPLGKAPAH
jgi:hypothetical protein